MKTRNVLFALAFCLANPAGASGLDSLNRMVAHPDVLCGQFAQQKTLKGVTKPLVSSGRFCVDRTRGILWHTRAPFDRTLKITRDEIVQYRNETVSSRLSASREPMVRVINSLVFSVISGRVGELGTYFDAKTATSGKSWQAELSAKNASVASVMKSIHLEGNTHISLVRLVESSGDVTFIRFSGIKTGAAAMTDAEQRILRP